MPISWFWGPYTSTFGHLEPLGKGALGSQARGFKKLHSGPQRGCYMGASKTSGPLFGSPYKKGHGILESFLGLPNYKKHLLTLGSKYGLWSLRAM